MTGTLAVEGMTCEHCEQTVEDALEAVSGVRAARADRETGQVTIEGDADATELVTAIQDAGYEARV